MQEEQAVNVKKGIVRKPLSKRTRFDVFKRDRFCCQYCGATPPSVVLEVDHIHPVSEGGSNQQDNLITSCFDCNRGKSNTLLTELPSSIDAKMAVIVEKREQIKAFEKLLKSERKHEESAIDVVESVFHEFFSGVVFTKAFRESVREFNKKLHADQVEFAMRKACSRKSTADQAVKYFCGICWNIIKDRGYGPRSKY